MNTSFFKDFRTADFLIAFFMLFLPKPGISQKVESLEELVQELFIAQTVYAQHKNEVQFTIKPAFWKIQGSRIMNIPLQLEYGFTDRLQVELGFPFGLSHSAIGESSSVMGNTEVGFLYNFLKGNKPFALSLAMEFGLPTEKRVKDIENAGVTCGPSLIVATQIGRSQVHISFGAEISRSVSSFNYNLAGVYPLQDWLATLELNGEIDDQKIIYITPGLVWKGLDDFEFGVGIPKSITNNSVSMGVIVMITHEFSLTRRDKHDQ